MNKLSTVSRHKAVRFIAVAFVMAGVASFINLTQADEAYNFEVRVYENDPSEGRMVSGVNVLLVADDRSNPSHGASGNTDGSGTVNFSGIAAGGFNVELRTGGSHYGRDYHISIDRDTTLEASLIPVVTAPPPPPPPGPTPPPPPPPPISVDGCTPTPPRGQPLLNIWPISTSGADCTDYPLLSAKNATQGGGYVSGGNVNANPGDIITVQLYVHNGTLDYPENEAINVMLRANVPGSQSSATISADAWANNAQSINSSAKGGDVTVNMSGSGSLSLVPGSAVLYDRGPSNARGFSDAVVNTGASVGNMRGCYEFLHFVTFNLRVSGAAVTPPPVVVVPPPPPVVPPPTVRPPVVPPPPPVFLPPPPPPVFPALPPPPPPPSNAFITIAKTVRNVTQGQTAFAESVSANPLDLVQFQIRVTASGNAALQNVVLTDVLPANFSLVSGQLTTSLGNMSPGALQTVNITASVNSANFPCNSSNWTNIASATATNAGTVSDTASVVVNNNCNQNATLGITKQVRNLNTGSGFAASTNASNNDQVQFRIVVSNTSNVTAVNVRLTDNLPGGLTYIPGSFTVDNGTSFGNLFNGSQSLGNLVPGQSRTITFNAQVSASSGQTLINNASASADNAGLVNAQASVIISGVTGNINLVLSKRAFNQTRNVDATTVTAQSGDIIWYTLTTQNNGNAAATNFVFEDNISDILQLSGLQDFGLASFDLTALTLRWPAVTIPAGGSASQTFSVKVNNSFPAGSDRTMTNIYGNTVNVRVPTVAGAFVAPPTGTPLSVSFVLALATLAGYAGFRRNKLTLNHV